MIFGIAVEIIIFYVIGPGYQIILNIYMLISKFSKKDFLLKTYFTRYFIWKLFVPFIIVSKQIFEAIATGSIQVSSTLAPIEV